MENTQNSKKIRKHSGFNAVDLLLVFIILALIAAALYAYLPGLLSDSGKDGTVEYTVVFEAAEPDAFASVQSGDSVLYGSSDFGLVKSVTSEPAYSYVYSEAENSMVKVTDSSKSKVTLVISAEADISETGYRADGKIIAAGLEYTLSFPTYTGSCRCISVVAGGIK